MTSQEVSYLQGWSNVAHDIRHETPWNARFQAQVCARNALGARWGSVTRHYWLGMFDAYAAALGGF